MKKTDILEVILENEEKFEENKVKYFCQIYVNIH